MPTPTQSLSAVIVSGGKQYRVAPGDRILVDRLAAEAGSELTLDRVLLVADGDDVKVGVPGVEGVTVTARVLGDRRGKKIDVLRYKSKKRVRVHRGARADLTALEILTVAGKGQEKVEKVEKVEKAERPARKAAAPKAEAEARPRRTRTTEAPAATAEAPTAAEVAEPKEAGEAPKPRRARSKPAPAAEAGAVDTTEESSDGA